MLSLLCFISFVIIVESTFMNPFASMGSNPVVIPPAGMMMSPGYMGMNRMFRSLNEKVNSTMSSTSKKDIKETAKELGKGIIGIIIQDGGKELLNGIKNTLTKNSTTPYYADSLYSDNTNINSWSNFRSINKSNNAVIEKSKNSKCSDGGNTNCKCRRFCKMG